MTGLGAAYVKAYSHIQDMPDSLKHKAVLLTKSESALKQALALSQQLGLGEGRLEAYEWLANVYELKQDYYNTYVNY